MAWSLSCRNEVPQSLLRFVAVQYEHIQYITDLATNTVNCYWQVEIKNLNSFSSVSRAIDFEIARQVELHSQGQEDQIVQETRLWEEGSQASAIMCSYIFVYNVV